ncbi:lectin-like domain-containing protein [Glycomyces endophyticus]
MAILGAGSMLLAAALAAVPATAGAQAPAPEKKVVLVNAPFTGKGDNLPPDALSLNACLTAATELKGVNEFDSCADQNLGPVPESGKSPGFLQLTDAGQYDAGAAIYDHALQNVGGIEVTFAQYQYGGTHADGISFFLVDGDTSLTEAGAYGGSLGYAQNTNRPGVDGGYLGLGLDAWGNFSADTEGRGAGCPEDYQAPDYLQVPLNRAPDNVALRGPGQGYEGYCLLATTATDEKIGTYKYGDLYGTDFTETLSTDTLEDAKRLVKLKITEGKHPTVTVDIDFLDGDGWERVLETTMPFEAPDTFKIGFASSTGRATDVHLIRHLRVETFVE